MHSIFRSSMHLNGRRHAGIQAQAILAILAIGPALPGAVGAPDVWTRSLKAQTHVLEPDADQQWHWHLYGRDSNAGATIFQPHGPGPGTLNIWLGDGHRPQALAAIPYDAAVRPRVLAVAPDASQVLVGIESPDASGRLMVSSLVVVPGMQAAAGHRPDAPMAVGRMAMLAPLQVRDACFLPASAGGGVVLLSGGEHCALTRIDAHRHEIAIATAFRASARMTPVPHRLSVWVGDEVGLHAVDFMTGSVSTVLERGEDDGPIYTPVFALAGDRAVVVRYGAHSNRVTEVAIALKTGAAEPLPGSFTTSVGVCLLRLDNHRFYLAEGDSPIHATGVVWSVGFAHGDVHREQ